MDNGQRFQLMGTAQPIQALAWFIISDSAHPDHKVRNTLAGQLQQKMVISEDGNPQQILSPF
jgi:hypothetical protein